MDVEADIGGRNDMVCLADCFRMGGGIVYRAFPAGKKPVGNRSGLSP
jgi:hypothetical protein